MMILLIFIIIFIIILLFYIYKEPFTTDIFIPEKELKFIHITKTGGSSIEECALKRKIYYGMNDIEYNKNNNYIGYKTVYGGGISRWHILFSQNSIEYKQKYDWFMVVRNPYTRVLSEINYILYTFIKNNIIDYSSTINDILQTHIMNRNNIGDHYTEQYLYLDPDPNILIHVLKFENLKEDFDNLMKLYNIDMVLDVHTNKSTTRIKMEDLNKDTINLINTVYSKDFELFNYDKINVD